MSGGIHFHDAPDRESPPTPRQLPADVRGFVNRVDELQELNAVLADEDGDPFVVSVFVIAGTAGAGKTSLALRWAHQARDHFPDGQLYVNLRGYDPGQPVTAHEALHRFLTSLGVHAQSVPQDLDAAAALYRSILAERRVLVLLDNAATVGQVRPCYPAAPVAWLSSPAAAGYPVSRCVTAPADSPWGPCPNRKPSLCYAPSPPVTAPRTTPTSSPSSPDSVPNCPSPCASPPSAPPVSPTCDWTS
ncbi:hypothetical protein [Kitasatospora acidiphila]|uniref:hypothetical protein n=1 Tax=Kitasatospora acidiphila TaxID=2567942 RepID=UPI002B40011B|nr:hypothetical protein [Kitasatospora acidiphila]